MTKIEVRAYLQTYCGIDLREEYCTLENVLNLIPNIHYSEQSEAFSLNVPINEHCFDSLAESNWLLVIWLYQEIITETGRWIGILMEWLAFCHRAKTL